MVPPEQCTHCVKQPFSSNIKQTMQVLTDPLRLYIYIYIYIYTSIHTHTHTHTYTHTHRETESERVRDDETVASCHMLTNADVC